MNNWGDELLKKVTDRAFAFAMLVLYLLASVIFTYINFQTRQSEIQSVSRSTLETTAMSFEHVAGVELGQYFSKDRLPDLAMFQHLSSKLKKWVDTLPVSYVYLVDKVEGKTYFVISNISDPVTEEDLNDMYYFPYPSAPDLLLKSFETQSIIYSPYYESKWGAFRSIYVPKKRADGSVYVLAADIRLESRHDILLESAIQSLWLVFLLLIPLVPMLYLYLRLQKKKEQQFKEGLYKNTLTGLPNLLQLHEDLLKEDSYRSSILISFADISEISAEYGQLVVDHVLLSIAQDLHQILPTSVVLYLTEENEFFILSNKTSEESLIFLAEAVLQKSKSSIQIQAQSRQTQNVVITLKVGIVQQAKGLQLIEYSKDALTSAVELGQSIFLFKMGMGREKPLENRYFWQSEMSQALAEERVVPFFQPIYDIAQNKVTRYEILVRLIDKEGEVITPYFFLEEIKMSYLYKEMTSCMIHKGFSAFSNRDESITLNLCKADLLNKETVALLKESMKRFGLDGRVTVEVVESDWIGYQDEVLAVLRDLRSSGVSVAIDDFGSGYSNFDQLLKIEVDYLKIDGSLIKAMFVSERALSMVKAIISLAKGLGVPVIPEFVENDVMLNKLKELGCEYAQGYVISAPIPSEKLPNVSH